MGDINRPIEIASDDAEEPTVKYTVVVIGEIKAKQSPRLGTSTSMKSRGAGIGGGGKLPKLSLPRSWIYNPSERAMQEFAAKAREQLRVTGAPLIPHGPVGVKAIFCKRPPQTCFTNGDRTRPKGKLLKAFESTDKGYTTQMKPDTDNCLKLVLDALKGIGWKDDYQVCKIEATKCYDSFHPFDGRTIIQFFPLREEIQWKIN